MNNAGGRSYVNPYTLLKLAPSDLDQGDLKKFQKAKKMLGQEIDLEGGRISWLPGVTLERSSAMEIADELLDGALRKWHGKALHSSGLTSFLAKPELSFFQDERASQSLLRELDSYGIKTWLSSQVVSSLAADFGDSVDRLDFSKITMVQAALAIIVEQDRSSFLATAGRKVKAKLDPLEKLRIEAAESSRKLSEAEIGNALSISKAKLIGETLGLIFHEEVSAAAETVRMIAIELNNVHHDPKLAHKVAIWSAEIAEKVPEVLARAKEAILALRKLHDERAEGGAKWKQNGVIYSIDGYGAVMGDITINLSEVEGVCWEHRATGDRGNKKIFWLEITGAGKKIIFRFQGLATNTIDALANRVIPALKKHIVPAMANKFQAFFSDSSPMSATIGEAQISYAGATMLRRRWLGLGENTKHYCLWLNLRAFIVEENLVLQDLTCRRAYIEVPLATKNAFVLWFFVNEILWGGHEELQG